VKTIVFKYRPLSNRFSPVIVAGLQMGTQWRVAEFYVDSGAAFTIMRAQFALDCGLDYTKGRKVFAQVGDGGFIPVFLNDLAMQIGMVRFPVRIGFSEKLGLRFHLLGRLDVFKRFRICFHEERNVVTFQPVDTAANMAGVVRIP